MLYKTYKKVTATLQTLKMTKTEDCEALSIREKTKKRNLGRALCSFILSTSFTYKCNATMAQNPHFFCKNCDSCLWRRVNRITLRWVRINKAPPNPMATLKHSKVGTQSTGHSSQQNGHTINWSLIKAITSQPTNAHKNGFHT